MTKEKNNSVSGKNWQGCCDIWLSHSGFAMSVAVLFICVVIMICASNATATAAAGFNQWQPFQVKQKLLLKQQKGSDKKAKGNLRADVKNNPQRDAETIRRQLPISPDLLSVYLADLPKKIWGSYRHCQQTSQFLHTWKIHSRKFVSADIVADARGRDDLLFQWADKEASSLKASLPYVRLSFFNREMSTQLGRYVLDHNSGRYDFGDMLLSLPSALRHQSLLEIMGRAFEPKVDLAVEF